jgi:His/Glu/Gln/Arg/opine family amino acid ABC transporter permease subunit
VTRATRFALIAFLLITPARQVWAQSPSLLVWGCDPEGGAPYVEADPSDPSRQVGFEVDIASLVAAHIGRQPKFSFVAFSSINQSLKRGDFDISFCGLEEITARRTGMAATIPYYQFREVLTVRAADKDRFHSLDDLRGRSVATLAATQAYELLTEPKYGITAISYEDDVHPYDDLVLGRVDAVLLDNVLAGREQLRRRGIVTQPQAVDVGYYVGVLSPTQAALRDRINEALLVAMKDGRLEAIFSKWGLWNDDQPALYAKVLADQRRTLPGEPMQTTATEGWAQAVRRYLPTLLTASLVTIGLSCASMMLAVMIGILVATGRVYGRWPVRMALKAYVELTRGTPVLLQLFVLYYGLASVIRLPAMLAAFLGLGLNYAAYESEIYRSALEAVPRGQLEAARTLGLSERQVLHLVRGPQAFRIALAPMTNDFVALLKDSSLVSVLTVVELTKQTQIFATNLGSWVVPGALCAALYLAMSLPLARLAGRLEQRWKAPTA